MTIQRIDLSKNANHRPCLLKDGTIRTLTRDFKNLEELYNYLESTAPFGDEIEERPNAEWYWILSCDAFENKTGIVTHMRTEYEGDRVQLIYRLEGYSAGFVTDIEFNLEACPSCINDEEIDKSVLTDARPDLSVFVSEYPLHPQHAKALRLLLSNIEYIDCINLFEDLKTYIAEAATCGLSHKRGEQMFSEIDSLVDAAINDCRKVKSNLPTVKEVLSSPKVDLSWE